MVVRHRQLRYFVTVAETGQITRAARTLNIAQPALSQAIAKLESDLGIELFGRNPRGVTLTPAGETFFIKARAALLADADATQTAKSLLRAAQNSVAVGFIGLPPAITAPGLFAAFADANPEARIAFHDLPFPRGATRDWLAGVDVAFCHPPTAEAGVSIRAVRDEPRAVVAHSNHPLAQRSELAVADVLDETFISYHPEIQAPWAGFHSLDDHRGGPPTNMTGDHALTSLQMLGIMLDGRAITIVPQSDADIAQRVVGDLVAIPLPDAAPATPSLIWRSDNPNPLVGALAACAGVQLA